MNKSLPETTPWWDGAARRRIDPGIAEQAIRWQLDGRNEAIEHFDARSRLKLASLFAGFFSVMLAFHWLPPSPAKNVAAVLTMGLFFIPYTRIFMHSQMHWGMGNTPWNSFLLDRFVSLIYSVPQTAYCVGHRMHHRYDNDLAAQGLPRDLQSTYLFSRDGRPSPIWLWVPYYMVVFQHLVAPALVFHDGSTRERLWYGFELVAVLGFHAALYGFDASFYVDAYLPALMLAWFASATVLYMMHAVNAHDFSLHPTNTSTAAFFNAFGDNDGYHLEHTLFPSVHPIYLRRLHQLLAPNTLQVLADHYFIAGIKHALGRRSKSACKRSGA